MLLLLPPTLLPVQPAKGYTNTSPKHNLLALQKWKDGAPRQINFQPQAQRTLSTNVNVNVPPLTCDLRPKDVHPGVPHVVLGLTGAVVIFVSPRVVRTLVLIPAGNLLRHRAEVTVKGHKRAYHGKETYLRPLEHE